MYRVIFEALIARVPAIQANLRYIYCDFERAITAAARVCLPGIGIRGCWFHYIHVSSKNLSSSLNKSSRFCIY